MTYRSTKTFGHETGLSVCFRQWRAESHCSLLHGYALAIKITFECNKLDDRQWCVDFGGFKGFKRWLESQFDHKLLVAQDDPYLDTLGRLQNQGICEMIVLSNVGCEAFAKHIFDQACLEFANERIRVVKVEVFEHGANSAIYLED